MHGFLLAGLLAQGMPQFSGLDPVRGQPWYHAKITWEGARVAGWHTAGDRHDTDRESAAAALAWHADFIDSYNYNPLWWGAGGFDRFHVSLLHQAELGKLHFDDVTSTAQATIVWTRYLAGTVAGVLWAAERDDVAAARNVVGAALHGVQDFYSHSNWVDEPARRVRTWFGGDPVLPVSADDPRHVMHLYTGAYEHAGHLAYKPHGKYALDCSIMRKVPSALMDAVCAPISPLSNTALCRRWRECKESTPARIPEVLGISIPEDLVYVEPPGIALDSPWLAQIAVQVRDLPLGERPSGPELFQVAYDLAVQHTRQWLTDLEAILITVGLEGFWRLVTTQPRQGTPGTFPISELSDLLAPYPGDTAQFEDPWRMPFAFASAGTYPPGPTGQDEGWYLRLEITTGDVDNAGTNADILAITSGHEKLLDHMHERTPQGGIGEIRLLEWNDFERNSRNTYLVGPFADLPTELVLRNRAADVGDVLSIAWRGIIDWAGGIVDSLRDLALSVIAGHADYVAADKATFSWNQLVRVANGHRTGFVLRANGGAEGEFSLSCSLSAGWDGQDIRVSVLPKVLICHRESDWDRGSSSDEPFVVLLTSSPANRQSDVTVIGPFSDVDAGEVRSLNEPPLTVTVPRYGGLIVPAQVWEHDDESAGDRRKIAENFQRGYDPEDINERSELLDAIGRMIGADWYAGSIDVYAFRRGATVEVAHPVRDWPLNRWVPGNSSITVSLADRSTRSAPLARWWMTPAGRARQASICSATSLLTLPPANPPA